MALKQLCRRLSSLEEICPEVTESIKALPKLIHEELKSESKELEDCSRYLFDGRGKSIRPTMVLLMAATSNYTQQKRTFIMPHQRTVAMVTEMIHTATLVHDDIIDGADVRRGKPSINSQWGEKKAVLTGNYILAEASRVLASIDNAQVIDLLANVLEDLVRGEIMQLSNHSDNEDKLFELYLQKTFKKTASLMAYSCQAVALLGDLNEELCQSAFHYGKNAGLAFQITDDVLDYQMTQSALGKPASVDLKLGLATAPILYAAQEDPTLYKLIRRNFQKPGDVEKAIRGVVTSSALTKSMNLAQEYTSKAVAHLNQFSNCKEKEQLNFLTREIIDRKK